MILDVSVAVFSKGGRVVEVSRAAKLCVLRVLQISRCDRVFEVFCAVRTIEDLK